MLGYNLFWGTLKLIGTWLLFRKCGRKGRYSLIPFVNHYQLGVCADREKDGRMLMIFGSASDIISLLAIIFEDGTTVNSILDILLQIVAIQTICRERSIIKREHRSGLHMSSYIMAHMVYQAFLCICQSGIMIDVLRAVGTNLPKSSYVTPLPVLDMLLTLFLLSYCADMIAMFISSIVKNPMTAMTIMPFMLMFQLIFAGLFFELKGAAVYASNFTLTKSGVTAICAQANYNDLPMVTIWQNLDKMRNVDVEGEKPIKGFLEAMEISGQKEEFMLPSILSFLYLI